MRARRQIIPCAIARRTAGAAGQLVASAARRAAMLPVSVNLAEPRHVRIFLRLDVHPTCYFTACDPQNLRFI